MTGWIKVGSKYVPQSQIDTLESIWAEYIRTNPGMQPSEEVTPSPGSPTTVELTGYLAPLIMDAWAWHWRCRYEATTKNGKTLILFTCLESENP